MVQYRQIKEQNPDSVLFFRLGDFYEMFEADAIEVSRILNLTLTKRNNQKMCGIPYHAAKTYIKRLLDAGKKIAICEQTELPEGGKQLAKREVVQVVTPATVVEDDFLQSDRDNYVLCVSFQKQGLSISYADITSGTFLLRFVDKDDRFMHLLSVLEQVGPREILVNEDDYFLYQDFQTLIDSYPSMVTKLPPWRFRIKDAYAAMCDQVGSASLKAFDLEENDVRLSSAGALLYYLQETAKTSLKQIEAYKIINEDTLLRIDEASRKSLELLVNLHDGSEKYSLFSSIDANVTSMGKRKLKNWITNALTDVDQILKRQQWVTLLYEDRDELGRVRSHLKQVLDIQRLTSRIAMGRHVSKDLVGIAQTIVAFFTLFEQRYQQLLPADLDQKALEALVALAQKINDAVNSEWQGSFEEGKVIRTGYDSELDELRSIKGGENSCWTHIWKKYGKRQESVRSSSPKTRFLVTILRFQKPNPKKCPPRSIVSKRW